MGPQSHGLSWWAPRHPHRGLHSDAQKGPRSTKLWSKRATNFGLPQCFQIQLSILNTCRPPCLTKPRPLSAELPHPVSTPGSPAPHLQVWPEPWAGSGRPTSHTTLPPHTGHGTQVKHYYFSQRLLLATVFPPKVFLRGWGKEYVYCPLMGTPALKRLWQTCKRSQLLAVYSPVWVCNLLCAHTQNPRLLRQV